MRLSEALDELLIATRVAGRSERTVQDYADKTARLVDFLGDKEIDQVTLPDLRRFMVHPRRQNFRSLDHAKRGKRLPTLLLPRKHGKRNKALRCLAVGGNHHIRSKCYIRKASSDRTSPRLTATRPRRNRSPATKLWQQGGEEEQDRGIK